MQEFKPSQKLEILLLVLQTQGNPIGVRYFESELVLSSLQQLIGINIIIYYSIQYFREEDSTGYDGTVLARSLNCVSSVASLLLIWKL